MQAYYNENESEFSDTEIMDDIDASEYPEHLIISREIRGPRAPPIVQLQSRRIEKIIRMEAERKADDESIDDVKRMFHESTKSSLMWATKDINKVDPVRLKSDFVDMRDDEDDVDRSKFINNYVSPKLTFNRVLRKHLKVEEDTANAGVETISAPEPDQPSARPEKLKTRVCMFLNRCMNKKKGIECKFAHSIDELVKCRHDNKCRDKLNCGFFHSTETLDSFASRTNKDKASRRRGDEVNDRRR
jgi:hypothetical protein